ncbi:MAG TPA: hypothetical protein VK524_20250 [Polyangiaceae bacterium]|nr:hypothetical protein [Polyangiaceae bacterium]
MLLGKRQALLWSLLLGAGRVAAEPRAPDGDYYELWVQSETHAELFGRALLPGPNGALVSSDTVAPLYQYVRLRARDLDTSWRQDSLDVELSLWGRFWIGEREYESTLDGDVQVANVGYRHGAALLRIGRQQVVGGAARYSRFDGARAGFELGAGLHAEAYAGLTVLPRWDSRHHYAYLGAAADSDLRGQGAVTERDRVDNALAGARLEGHWGDFQSAVSFQEQRDAGGLGRRSFGLDTRGRVTRRADVGGNAVLEIDARRFSDARVWTDVRATEQLDVSLEYLHTEPALFLSRQSVLSVFSSDAYDELGGTLSARATSRMSLDGGGFVQRYEEDELGARGEVTARWLLEQSRRTLVRFTYTRVQAPDNGYHSLRSSLARELLPKLRGTGEVYTYFYDEAIRGYRTSSVFAGTLSFKPSEPLEFLCGASVVRSAYAELDAQALVQLRGDFDLSRHGGPP